MRGLACSLVLVFLTSVAGAAELRATVRDGTGAPVNDAVVWAISEGSPVSPPSSEAIMDQINRTFVPHVLAVQTGTAVRFPNSDNVRHQVYSFSAPKRFQLPLYEGSPAKPIVFDKPGVVALGCNIHDKMSGFIVIVDTPWFGKTTEGKLVLSDLPPGVYNVRVWHEKLRGEPPESTVTLAAETKRDLDMTIGGP
jgi:plastocyanin